MSVPDYAFCCFQATTLNSPVIAEGVAANSIKINAYRSSCTAVAWGLHMLTTLWSCLVQAMSRLCGRWPSTPLAARWCHAALMPPCAFGAARPKLMVSTWTPCHVLFAVIAGCHGLSWAWPSSSCPADPTLCTGSACMTSMA